jgi:hypothetical protein
MVGERGAGLREGVAELQARGIIVELPYACANFDPGDRCDRLRLMVAQ